MNLVNPEKYTAAEERRNAGELLTLLLVYYTPVVVLARVRVFERERVRMTCIKRETHAFFSRSRHNIKQKRSAKLEMEFPNSYSTSLVPGARERRVPGYYSA